jgi:hypothetical protein
MSRWAQMLDEFRALGGVADNVEQRKGRWGNGLFPIDPLQPVKVSVPEDLLVATDDLVLEGEDLVVRQGAPVSPPVRDFMNRYQREFSWGADGRRGVESFEVGLKQLPKPLLARLQDLRILNLDVRHKGEWGQVLRQRFLVSRQIDFHERKVIMPVMELVNHDPASPGYAIGRSIDIAGTFADEVTVNYSPTSDPLLRFLNYGFASPEPQAFSLPMRLLLPPSDIVLVVSVVPGDMRMEGKVPLPTVKEEGNALKFSHFRIGMERAPRLPKSIARQILAGKLAADAADEALERVRSANQVELCRLLELCEGSSEIVRDFRRALTYQLRAMAYCYGARDIPAASK